MRMRISQQQAAEFPMNNNLILYNLFVAFSSSFQKCVSLCVMRCFVFECGMFQHTHTHLYQPHDWLLSWFSVASKRSVWQLRNAKRKWEWHVNRFYGLALLVFFIRIVPIYIKNNQNTTRTTQKGINNYHESLIKISSLCPSLFLLRKIDYLLFPRYTLTRYIVIVRTDACASQYYVLLIGINNT